MKPRYIRVASDLHLEQYSGQRAQFLVDTFLPADPRDSECVLVLAGDISSKPLQLYEFLKAVEARFPRVYYVPGNHEFYGHNMDKWARDFTTEMGSSMITAFATLGISYDELENVRFIFGTLWGDGGKSMVERCMVEQGLRDFFVIRNSENKKFTVPDMQRLHDQQKADIKRLLAQPFEGITVVVTHHLPSYRLCHPRFGTEINGGFAANCDDILAYDDAPDVWIHGHTHDTGDGVMWNTRIVCNPSGYYFETDARYKNYKPKFIDLENVREDESPSQEST